MKNNSEKNIDAYFSRARKIPVEIPIEKMEKIILNFPDHPAILPQQRWFIKLFNLKYIAMILIPLLTVLTFWWVPVSPIISTDTPNTDLTETSLTIPEISTIGTENLAKIPVPNFSKSIFPLPVTPPKRIDSNPESIANIQLTQENSVPESRQTTIRSEERRISEKKNYRNTTTYIQPDLISETATPIPEISSYRLKKLRRILYKNLIADGLLISKFTTVEMQLYAEKILINEQPIPDKFLLKYKNLTAIVGSGPERKIKMNSNFILAGDFGETGFRGNGVGTFNDQIMEMEPGSLPPFLLNGDLNLKKDSLGKYFNTSEKIPNDSEDILEMERKALNLFANKIQQNTPDDPGRKRLFSPNLNGSKGKNLHAALRLLLLEDGYLDSENELAVIELPNNLIRINGAELTGEKILKYQRLIDKYNIKHGRDRMILLSPHFLKAGNYSYGNFTGAIITLPFED